MRPLLLIAFFVVGYALGYLTHPAEYAMPRMMSRQQHQERP